MTHKVTLFVSMITIWSSLLMAQPSDSSIGVDQMVNILSPYVRSLDRDVWTFRYEARDHFSPKNSEDLKPRIANWANRFWNVDIQHGADVGPGVYVATDPVSTATWGRIHPRMFAIKLVQGTQILIGDQFTIPAEILKQASELSQLLSCGRASTSIQQSIGSIVGFFRMNEKKECRQVVVDAFRRLSLQALTYGFNSVALEGCRTTGTAISIIHQSAVAFEELNWYAEEGKIEGNHDVTPFIRSLYFEALPDLYSQTLIANRETLSRFRRGYGFFDQIQSPTLQSYRDWKNSTILKCGLQWSVESKIPDLIREYQNAKKHADPAIKELLIQLSVIYRERAEDQGGLADAPPEFKIEKLKALRPFAKIAATENLIRFATGQVPNLTGVPVADEKEYRKILQDCLKEYSNPTNNFSTIAVGRCGVDIER